MKALYLITLLCLLYKIKLNKCYSKANSDSCPKMCWDSLVNLT